MSSHLRHNEMAKRYFSFICKRCLPLFVKRLEKHIFHILFHKVNSSWFISVFQIKHCIIILEVVRALMACFCNVLFLASKRKKLLKGCACQWCSYWSCLNYKHSTLKAFIFTELLSYIISLSPAKFILTWIMHFPPVNW